MNKKIKAQKGIILFDSLLQKQVLLTTLQQEVRLFSCGPTVYDDVHIGNARPILLVDTIIRLLRCYGKNWYYLMNITDIDDKIIKRAQTTKREETALANDYKQAFFKCLHQLGIIMPNKMVPISEVIPEQIMFIQDLINLKVAYTSGGNVYFNIQKFLQPGLSLAYNQLAKVNLATQIINTDRNIITNKKHNYDFVLWKATTNGIKFMSPWGAGRPGWHTECAVVNHETFQGATIDLHVGGVDLKFPHHENERIQYIARHGRDLARIWIYNGHLSYQDEKMSKSIGNVIYLKDFLKENGADALRFIFLNSPYQKPLKLTPALIHEAKRTVKKLAQFTNNITKIKGNDTTPAFAFWNKFIAAISFNLNYANGFTILYQWMKHINTQIKNELLSQVEINLWCYVYFELLGMQQAHQPNFKYKDILEQKGLIC